MRDLFAATLLCGACATAPQPEPAPVPEPVPPAAVPADPADVESIDALLSACYDVISGDAGERRDWDRFRSLFHPRLGRLMPVGRLADGGFAVGGRSPQEYVESASEHFAEAAFFEVEIVRRTERFGHVAHVFSTYESRRTADGEPFARGVNSFQLFGDGDRWWILSILWDVETPEQPLPDDYLPSGS